MIMGRAVRIVDTFGIWVAAAVILAFVNYRLAIVVVPAACFSTVLLWRWGRASTGEKA